MDLFFSKKVCDRCGAPLTNGRTMSMFNEDCICMKCKKEETQRADYTVAQTAEENETKIGNYNFKGIGLK